MTGPVFVWPRPRTGGSLLATMLGVNSELAMSYEMYECDLVCRDGYSLRPGEVSELILASREKTGRQPGRAWINQIAEPELREFFIGCARSGLPAEALVEEFLRLDAQNLGLGSLDGRLELIDRLMIRVMHSQGKQRWGGKARAALSALSRRHPDAVFFMVVRDGRDVLASRQGISGFDHDPASCATEWQESLFEFRLFLQRPGVLGRMVDYADLVRYPECELRHCCELAGLKFEERMLAFEHYAELPNRPYGHSSAVQLASGLNTNSLGRWRHELDEQQLGVFERIAGDALVEFGFRLSATYTGQILARQR